MRVQFAEVTASGTARVLHWVPVGMNNNNVGAATKMDSHVSVTRDDFSDAVLPSQFTDLIWRRSSAPQGESRLLWAALEDAIRTYLVNVKCATQKQHRAFEEVRTWFFPPKGAFHGLFSFQGICGALDIDAKHLLRGLAKLHVSDLPMRRYGRALRIARIPRMAA
jgi:hypothetical protein